MKGKGKIMELCIAVYKEPDGPSRVIGTFNHCINLDDDMDRNPDTCALEHIGLHREIHRVGKALVGTEKELREHIENNMQGKGFDMRYMYFIQLLRVPENGDITAFESWFESADLDGFDKADIAEAAFMAGRNS